MAHEQQSPMSSLLTEINRFVELQTMLLTEFCRRYPQAADCQWLIEAPGTGCLSTREGLWLFRKHGAGVSFVNAEGVWIDPHRAVESPELFDAWRLQLYLESASEQEYPDRLDAELAELVNMGKLVRCSDGLFRLADPPADELSLKTQPSHADRDTIARLVANGLYQIRTRLGTGHEEGLTPNVVAAARLAYALHNEALSLFCDQYEADLDGALRRIEAIDEELGEQLLPSFEKALCHDLPE